VLRAIEGVALLWLIALRGDGSKAPQNQRGCGVLRVRQGEGRWLTGARNRVVQVTPLF